MMSKAAENDLSAMSNRAVLSGFLVFIVSKLFDNMCPLYYNASPQSNAYPVLLC